MAVKPSRFCLDSAYLHKMPNLERRPFDLTVKAKFRRFFVSHKGGFMVGTLAQETKFFDGQYATKEDAQAQYKCNLFTRAAVFKNKESKYSIAYICDVASETPHETAKAVKNILDIDMVSFISPLVGTWTDYKNPEEQLRGVLSNLAESQGQDAGLTDLEREGITQEIIDQVVLDVGFSPVIPERWGKSHNVYKSAKKGFYVVDGIGAVAEDELKVMRVRYLLNSGRHES